MYPPIMELIVRTTKMFTGFIPFKSKAEIVISVGMGMKLENIPLKKSPKRPYFMNNVSCSIELKNPPNIVSNFFLACFK